MKINNNIPEASGSGADRWSDEFLIHERRACELLASADAVESGNPHRDEIVAEKIAKAHTHAALAQAYAARALVSQFTRAIRGGRGD